MSLMWTRPSMPSSMPTKTPKSVIDFTAPSTIVPTGYFSSSSSHGFGLELLQAERDALVLRVDLEHLALDLVADVEDLGRVLDPLGPGHLADVDEALDAGFELDERAVVGDRHDLALDLLAGRERLLGVVPRIR